MKKIENSSKYDNMKINEIKKDYPGNKRIVYFDALRILASFFIIIIHVSSAYWEVQNIYSFEWQAMTLFNGISRWGVPIFVMMSGALFLNRNVSISELYRKYILRLAVSFVFWSLGYALLYYFFDTEKSLINFFASIIKGHYHMWFIYMITGLYIITPFLAKIVKNERLLMYFLILSFIFAIVIPQICSIVGIINYQYGKFIETVVNQTHLKFLLGYSFYYVLGYYLSHKKIGMKESIIIYCCGIIGFVSTVFFTETLSMHKGLAIGIFFNNMTVNIAFESLAIYIFVMRLLSNRNINDKTCLLISSFSKYSFGAYLIHALIITILDKRFGLTSISFNTYIAVPLISIVVFIISYAISALLNHVPCIKKYIV